MDRNSLTVVTGIASKQSFSYSSISEVKLKGLTSFTSTLVIVPYRGKDIELVGFSRSQFKLIQQTVAAGYFDDASASDIDDEEVDDSYDDEEEEGKVSRKGKSKKVEEIDEEELKEKKETERLNAEINKVRDIGMSTDEDGIIASLNQLLNVLDDTATTDTDEQEEKTSLRETARKKFDSQFKLLKMTYPQNKMIPYYSSKVQEWTEKEAERKQKDKKKTIILVCLAVGIPLLMILFAVVLL